MLNKNVILIVSMPIGEYILAVQKAAAWTKWFIESLTE